MTQGSMANRTWLSSLVSPYILILELHGLTRLRLDRLVKEFNAEAV